MSSRLRAIARNTVTIAEDGRYEHDGRTVQIGEQVARAIAGTRLHLPDEELHASAGTRAPIVEVTGESSLVAARRLGGDVACPVFASARATSTHTIAHGPS